MTSKYLHLKQWLKRLALVRQSENVQVIKIFIRIVGISYSINIITTTTTY